MNYLQAISEYTQKGIFITYDVTNQKSNGSWEEGNQLYTYSFYITPENEDYIYVVSVNDLEDGYKECLNWLSESDYSIEKLENKIKKGDTVRFNAGNEQTEYTALTDEYSYLGRKVVDLEGYPGEVAVEYLEKL